MRTLSLAERGSSSKRLSQKLRNELLLLIRQGCGTFVRHHSCTLLIWLLLSENGKFLQSSRWKGFCLSSDTYSFSATLRIYLKPAILLLYGLTLSFSLFLCKNLYWSLYHALFQKLKISFSLWHICFFCYPLFFPSHLPCSLSPSGSWAGSFLASCHLIGWVTLLFNTLNSHSALQCSGAAPLQCLLHHQMLDADKDCLCKASKCSLFNM